MDRTFFARIAAAALVAALLVPLAAPDAAAQYFGRNKVRYDAFDFQVLETEHFDLFYYPEEEQAARDVARMAERWYDRLSTILDHEFDERKTIVLYADDADFRQTNVVTGLIGEGTQGVTEGLKQRVVLPVASSYAETDHVLGHELVHQFQYDIATRESAFQQFVRLPLWVIEGMAEYFSVGREDALTAMWMRDAVLRDAFPTLDQLSNRSEYNEYQYGQPFWAYVGGEYGDEAAVRLFKTALTTPLDSAIVAVTGLTPDSLSVAWGALMNETYRPLAAGRGVPTVLDGDEPAYPDSLPALTSRRVLARNVDSGDLNIAPAVSPDGRYVAFLSERDLFGIDLYLADAQTGQILKKLESVGTDPHFDAIRFIESAGTWSPDGRSFAYVVFADGDNEIAVLDVESRSVARRIAVDDIGAIKDPAWSPDGRQIAFSGVKGGIADLYAVDLETETVRQLTNDRYTDLQATWSPDGQTIAFATDRGPGTNFERLTYAKPRLALYSVATGEVEILDLFDGAKHINPAFSPDGRSLYFLSNPDGFNNIYRLALGEGEAPGALYRVTNVATGVAGIADLSPAFSVAKDNGRLMYSLFEAQNYTVFALDADEAVGTPITAADTEGNEAASLLPPSDAARRSVIEGYLADDATGLPESRAFPSRAYRPRLSLDYVSQPSVGAVYDPNYGSGFGIAGGIQLLFSDQLSDNVLGVAVAANGTLRDIGGQALYLNQGRRLNYGALVGHVPYLQAFIGAPPEGTQTAQVAGLTRYYLRTYVTQASGLAAYPLNQSQRFESSLGYRRIGYGLEYDAVECQDDFCAFTGRESAPGSDSLFTTLNMVEGGAAFVGDYSYFGLTSPVRGARYRFGVDGTFGTLNFATVTADYRTYFFTRPPGFPKRLPVTFAFRGLHYGRYGPDAESGQLYPLYLGYGTLVRGYTSSSFESDEAYRNFLDRLFGSRVGVATAEMRIPLLGVPEFGLLNFPYLPTELTLFADAGLAWGRISQFRFVDSENDEIGKPFSEALKAPIYSVGASVRINVLGALILEPYYAFPLARDDVSGGVFGFNITPGW